MGKGDGVVWTRGGRMVAIRMYVCAINRSDSARTANASDRKKAETANGKQAMRHEWRQQPGISRNS